MDPTRISWLRFIDAAQIREVFNKDKISFLTFAEICFCKLDKYISQTEQIFKTHEAAAFLVRHWHFVFMLTQSSATFSAKQDRNKSLRAIKAVKPGEASAVKTVNQDQHYTLRRS